MDEREIERERIREIIVLFNAHTMYLVESQEYKISTVLGNLKRRLRLLIGIVFLVLYSPGIEELYNISLS